MGCCAGVTALGLARNILQVLPWGSDVLVVSTETLGPHDYKGNTHSMQLGNILFPMGESATLLSTCKHMARFKLGRSSMLMTALTGAFTRWMIVRET